MTNQDRRSLSSNSTTTVEIAQKQIKVPSKYQRRASLSQPITNSVSKKQYSRKTMKRQMKTRTLQAIIDTKNVTESLEIDATATTITRPSIGAKESTITYNCRKNSSVSELSDCGYGTQVENPEFLSTTSSNEDDKPPCHQKPPSSNQKQRYNAVNNPRSAITIQDKKEWRRKKLVKRSKSNL